MGDVDRRLKKVHRSGKLLGLLTRCNHVDFTEGISFNYTSVFLMLSPCIHQDLAIFPLALETTDVDIFAALDNV